MSKLKIADRIAARNQARIDALRQAIKTDGIEAAIEYAESVLKGEGSTNLKFRKLLAIQVVELNPNEPAIWDDRELNTILRSICAEAIASGESLSEHLRAFASQALMKAMPPRGRGQPGDQWQRYLVLAVLRDLNLAKVPVYHGEASNAKANFTGVQIVKRILLIPERTLREWWQSRPKTDRGTGN
jgi:hypothetical protein